MSPAVRDYYADTLKLRVAQLYKNVDSNLLAKYQFVFNVLNYNLVIDNFRITVK